MHKINENTLKSNIGFFDFGEGGDFGGGGSSI